MEAFLERHSGETIILILSAMVLGTLLVVVPQLLRSHAKTQELRHTEHLRALEAGQEPVTTDERSRIAGRVVVLVPMVSVCTAGTVTCFLAAYRFENLFAVALACWSVAGVISLAAITGGVALLGRLAQLHAGQPVGDEEDEAEEPLETLIKR